MKRTVENNDYQFLPVFHCHWIIRNSRNPISPRGWFHSWEVDLCHFHKPLKWQCFKAKELSEKDYTRKTARLILSRQPEEKRQIENYSERPISCEEGLIWRPSSRACYVRKHKPHVRRSYQLEGMVRKVCPFSRQFSYGWRGRVQSWARFSKLQDTKNLGLIHKSFEDL